MFVGCRLFNLLYAHHAQAGEDRQPRNAISPARTEDVEQDISLPYLEVKCICAWRHLFRNGALGTT